MKIFEVFYNRKQSVTKMGEYSAYISTNKQKLEKNGKDKI